MFPVAASRQKQSKEPRRVLHNKRPRPNEAAQENDDDDDDCSFCGQVPACLIVQMPPPVSSMSRRTARSPTAYCLTCYYTTSAVRQDPSKYVSVCNQGQVDAQLVPMQQLFSEAFIDLRKQLHDEADKAFSKQKSDPLAMLLHGASTLKPASASSPSRRTRAPKPGSHLHKDGKMDDGGFLRSVPLPERLLQSQQEQAMWHQAQISRMNQVAAATLPAVSAAPTTSTTNTNIYQRRKSSKKSIWNLAMDLNTQSMDPTEGEKAAQKMEVLPSCSCGSQNVSAMGNITSRNQDVKKGETWGMKDRGSEVVSRYQCNTCGKMWNEEE